LQIFFIKKVQVEICPPIQQQLSKSVSTHEGTVNRTSSKSSSDNMEMLTSGMFKIHKRTFAVSFISYSSVVFLMPVVHIFDEQRMNKYLDAKSCVARMKHIWNTPLFFIQSTERQRPMHNKIKGAYA